MGAKHWFDTNEGIDSLKYVPTGRTREQGSLLPNYGLETIPGSKQAELDTAAQAANAADKAAADEAKRKADEAKRKAEQLEKEAVKLGKTIGLSLSKGIMDNDWCSLGQNIASYIASQMDFGSGIGGGIMGGLFGGLLTMGVNKLFGGGKKKSPMGTRSDPIHTLMINAEDIATAFLVATQNAQLRGAGAGLTQLESQRLAQATAGLTV